MDTAQHALAGHLPPFITAPGETDYLFILMAFVLIGAVLAVGVFFFWLHSLPERMVHNRVQYDLVAVLALLSLFTHIHAFWVAALILALIKIPEISLPNFLKPLTSMANSLETISSAPAATNAETANGATASQQPSPRTGTATPPASPRKTAASHPRKDKEVSNA